MSCRLWVEAFDFFDFLGILLGCWDVGTQAMQRQSHRDSHTVPGKEISLDTRGCLSDRSNETAEEGKLEVKKNSAGTMNLYLCSNCTLLNNIYKQWVAQ